MIVVGAFLLFLKLKSLNYLGCLTIYLQHVLGA
jgi:hypothetical protein